MNPFDPALLTQITHRAMATEFVVMLPAGCAGAVDPVLQSLEYLDDVEAALTIYREDSEISNVNRLAARMPVELSGETFALLERAVYWSERTDGAFDITAGPLVEAWGFTRRSGRKPTSGEINEALGRVGYEHLILDSAKRAVQFGRDGMSINLGAIGKGDALDRLAARLQQSGLEHFLIHGGQSSVIAFGDQIPGSGHGWAVGISHPTKPQRRLAGIWLRNRALATSGSGQQFFHHQGRRYGHVIDPRTGYPAGDLQALTVVTESAADADACATGFFVAGSSVIRQRSESETLPAMIAVRPGKRQDEVSLESFGEIDWVERSEEMRR